MMETIPQQVADWRRTGCNNLTHFFGEMDLDLTKNMDDVYSVAFFIAENSGYFVSKQNNVIELYGQSGQPIKIVFDISGKCKDIILSNGEVIPSDNIPSYPGYKNGFNIFW